MWNNFTSLKSEPVLYHQTHRTWTPLPWRWCLQYWSILTMPGGEIKLHSGGDAAPLKNSCLLAFCLITVGSMNVSSLADPPLPHPTHYIPCELNYLAEENKSWNSKVWNHHYHHCSNTFKANTHWEFSETNILLYTSIACPSVDGGNEAIQV